LLTLRGAWDRVRQDPILKFMVVAVTAYGMSTFEGPMMSIKSVNALSHYTDWTIGHVHIGALGWNGLLTFGVLYWLIPRIYNTKLHSVKLANTHFWIATLGMIFYAVPLYWAGITQGLMWKQFTPEGFLMYPNFLETVIQIIPMYMIRAFGGLLYFAGLFFMLFNIVKTVKSGSLVAEEEAQAPALVRDPGKSDSAGHWHRWLESRPVQFSILAFVAVAIGGLIEIVPMYLAEHNVPTITAVKPYTPLELQGRDVYIAEGCYVCHSQMIRPFRSETARYGEYSKSGEFVYDHPFQWGSKRNGPDLHRIGKKYPDAWHYKHMENPDYPWMLTNKIDIEMTPLKVKAMRALGVPYPEGFEALSVDELRRQADLIVDNLKNQGVPEAQWDSEIVALIAYMQRLGTDISNPQAAR